MLHDFPCKGFCPESVLTADGICVDLDMCSHILQLCQKSNIVPGSLITFHMSDDRDKTIHQKTSDPFFNIIFLISVAEFHKHISGTCKGKPPSLLKAFHHIHTGMEFTAQIKSHAFITNIHGCST